ncbi:MAG TPA: hypothetical protein VE010_20700 [Thermoanaerobaculia bacterium]|nr:hypothetical protein [Thermoanaerobaculia bacterium]
MTRTTRRTLLWITAIASALVLALFLLNLDVVRDEERPRDVNGLARWIAERPADWLAASALTDRSLDSNVPRRRELWHSGYALAEHLAPRRPNTSAGFVRAGLFHWYELGPHDRKAVLDVAASLMADPVVFASLSRPLWQLTHDFAYLRRVAPNTLDSLANLRELAITNGLFAEYRELRAASRALRLQSLAQRRSELAVADLISYLPAQPDIGDAPLARAILEELNQRAFDARHGGGRAEELAVFAIEHRLQPLIALSPFVETREVLTDRTRVRLARALGDEAAAQRIELMSTVPKEVQTNEWTGPCGATEVCSSAFKRHAGPLTFTVDVSQSDEVPPYVEIYVNRVLAAEGEVREARSFTVGGSGANRIEVRLVNPRTRNGIQRRVRLS